MPLIQTKITEEVDHKINIFKAENKISDKGDAVNEVLERFFRIKKKTNQEDEK